MGERRITGAMVRVLMRGQGSQHQACWGNRLLGEYGSPFRNESDCSAADTAMPGDNTVWRSR
jgi:hypothetical protein